MGFDNIYLGEEDFKYYNAYGNRSWLDSDNYQDLIDIYEQGNGSKQFFYMLTFQNHGGYEQNEADFDLVHVTDDYGDLTDDLNEYLTSIHMSVQALVELTEYFSNVEEPVIIAMVGDHAPSIIGSLLGSIETGEEPSIINGIKVPYFIWANYEVTYPEVGEYISMTDLVPMIIETSGLPMSSYYSTIRQLQTELPVRTSHGMYIDKDGNIGEYSKESPYYDMLTNYYYMEYNSIVGGADYQSQLFEPLIGE